MITLDGVRQGVAADGGAATAAELSFAPTGTISATNVQSAVVEVRTEPHPFEQVVIVAKSGGDFTDIQSAIDSITDAGASKPYAVLIYPGEYDLGSGGIAAKSYVSVKGVDRHSVVIKSTSTSVSVFDASGTQNLEIANFTILHNDSMNSIYSLNVDNTTDMVVRNVVLREFGSNSVHGIYASGTTRLLIEDCDIDVKAATIRLVSPVEAVVRGSNLKATTNESVSLAGSADALFTDCKIWTTTSLSGEGNGAIIFSCSSGSAYVVGCWLKRGPNQTYAITGSPVGGTLYLMGNWIDGPVKQSVNAKFNDSYSGYAAFPPVQTPPSYLPKGAGYLDTDDDSAYVNIGTVDSACWNKIGSQ